MGTHYSLHLKIRTMNEHMRNVHKHCGFNVEEFKDLQTVAASKTGPKLSYVAVQVVRPTDDFRNEHVFEAKVGLLKSCFFHQSEEAALVQQKRGVVDREGQR